MVVGDTLGEEQAVCGDPNGFAACMLELTHGLVG
jgi:hypothetical protein